jgi:small ligand-binding sensory domain FIST
MLNKNQEKSGIFRTILDVNEDDGSLILAGDIAPNSYLKLMHSSTEKLIAGAETAAAHVTASLAKNMTGESLAILVSCVGRKLVMGDRISEEVEVVAEMLGKDVSVTGFYSNGEIAGNQFLGDYQLHNQTMTISYISET